ncbi:MAG: HDOD domain-containing protein [Pseudomonadota bacterium]
MDNPAHPSAVRLSGRIPVIGDYRLSRAAGQAYHANTYLARNTRNGRPVLVRLFKDSYAEEPHRSELVTRFRRLAAIEHASLLPIVDADVYRGYPFVVFAHTQAVGLPTYLDAHGTQTVAELLGLFAQAITAVGELHRRALVHGSIEPATLLVEPSGELRLSTVDAPVLTSLDTLPEALALRWDPPELMRGAQPTARADVYALAQIFAVLLEFASLRPRRAAAPRRTLEPRLRAILRRATHRDPDVRYHDAMALGEAVDTWQRTRDTVRDPDWAMRRLRNEDDFGTLTQSHHRLNALSQIGNTIQANDLGGAVLREPQLAERLVRLANANYFPARGDFRGVSEVVRTAGAKSVHTLCRALLVIEASIACPSEAGKRLIAKAILRGFLTRELATETGADPQSAFLAGVFVDLGQLVTARYLPDLFETLTVAESDHAPDDIVRAILGMTYTNLTQWVGNVWQIPDEWVDLDGPSSNLPIAKAVHAANRALIDGVLEDHAAITRAVRQLTAMGPDFGLNTLQMRHIRALTEPWLRSGDEAE